MAMVHSIINFWRESKAYRDGSVPGWLEVGTMALMPGLEPGAAVQSKVDIMPATVRNSPHLYPSIERGGGYVNLKIGQYKMQHSKKKRRGAPGGTINCLQVIEHGNIDQILIHDAMGDSSTQLEGCIGPGLRKKTAPGMGILDSKGAMDEIWKLLGGYTLGNKVTLNVWSNVPGETRTKLTWGKLK